ncbi:MAG: DUF3244 domain-containing protein [Bacteroidales bacterium]|nr:DUF3244 domain-containing protein [Bacteroidales bacterium]
MTKFIVTLVLLFCSAFYGASNPGTPNGTGDIVEIPIKKDKKTRPRTPDFGSDITAYYQDGVVYLQFSYDMGEVDVTVTNETTGEMWQQTDDSAFGSASIATSASAGSYTISIVTDDGVCYSGSFAL